MSEPHCCNCQNRVNEQDRFAYIVRAAAETSAMKVTDGTCNDEQIKTVNAACKWLTKLFEEQMLPKGLSFGGTP